jgi:hypothetical protein
MIVRVGQFWMLGNVTANKLCGAPSYGSLFEGSLWFCGLYANWRTHRSMKTIIFFHRNDAESIDFLTPKAYRKLTDVRNYWLTSIRRSR